MAKYDCRKCGGCCKNFELFISDEPENLSKRSLIERFIVEHMGVSFSRIDNISVKVYGPCYYFNEETNRCRIYKTRPARCRGFYCKRSKDNGEKKSKKSSEKR